MAAAQVGLWPLLPFLYLFLPQIRKRHNILRCKSYLFYLLSKRMVYLYFLGSEWWCFETKCQSFRPKGLLAWNRVSLSKQVSTRIRRKGGFYQFLFCYSVCSQQKIETKTTRFLLVRYCLLIVCKTIDRSIDRLCNNCSVSKANWYHIFFVCKKNKV